MYLALPGPRGPFELIAFITTVSKGTKFTP